MTQTEQKKQQPTQTVQKHQAAENRNLSKEIKTESLAYNSPQNDQLSQLKSIADNYHQVQKQQSIAAQIHSSPHMVAQQKIMDTVQGHSETPIQKAPMPNQVPSTTGLQDNLKTGNEHFSGMTMDDVKIQNTSGKPEILQGLFDKDISGLKDEYLVNKIRKELGGQGERSAIRKLISSAKNDGDETYNYESLLNYVGNGLGLNGIGQSSVSKSVKEPSVSNNNKKENSPNKKINIRSKAPTKALPKKLAPQNLSEEKENAAPVNHNNNVNDENAPGNHNIKKDKQPFSDKTTLIPKTLAIHNLFRADTRPKDKLIKDNGFRPGQRPKGYVAKLKAYLATRGPKESESDSKTAINRESGKNINDGKILVDLVYSMQKIQIDSSKKITLLNYVCSGPETGAGGQNYLIQVDETFECISASPTMGLYQSGSGMQILAIAQSAKGGYAKFTEYDFLTPVPTNRIYYASKDNGKSQEQQGSSWFRVSDGSAK